MVGVAQENIRPRGAHGFWHHRFDSGRRAHRHKGRRANIAARGGDHARACAAILGVNVKSKALGHGCLRSDALLRQTGRKAKGGRRRLTPRAQSLPTLRQQELPHMGQNHLCRLDEDRVFELVEDHQV